MQTGTATATASTTGPALALLGDSDAFVRHKGKEGEKTVSEGLWSDNIFRFNDFPQWS